MSEAPLNAALARHADLADTTPADLLDQATGLTGPQSPVATVMRAGWASADLVTETAK